MPKLRCYYTFNTSRTRISRNWEK